jgi:hypothetical protein
MAICPNCSKPVEVQATGCTECGADFSTKDGWKPVLRPVDTRRPAVQVNILIGAAVFAVLVPPIGALAWMLPTGGGQYPPLLLAGLLMSYVFVLEQAVVAGFAHACFLFLIVRLGRVSRVPAFACVACGLVAIGVSWLVPNAQVLLNAWKDPHPHSPSLLVPSLIAAGIAALISAHFWPAGDERQAHERNES